MNNIVGIVLEVLDCEMMLILSALFLFQNLVDLLHNCVQMFFSILTNVCSYFKQSFAVSSIYYENPPIGKGFTGSNCTFFRTEEVRYRKRDGQAKILGIVLCVSGALLMLIYKGPTILTSLVTKKIPPNSTTLRPRSKLLMEELIMGFEGTWGIDRWTLGGLLCHPWNSFYEHL